MSPDLFIFITIALCFIGIAYFHITGQAKWAEKDKEMSISWLVGCAIGIPQIFIIYSTMKYASHYVLPSVLSSLPTSVRPGAGFLFMAAVLFGIGSVLRFSHQCLVARWKPWQQLDSLIRRGEAPRRTWDISGLLEQFHKWRKRR